jgi:hypothetical protein
VRYRIELAPQPGEPSDDARSRLDANARVEVARAVQAVDPYLGFRVDGEQVLVDAGERSRWGLEVAVAATRVTVSLPFWHVGDDARAAAGELAAAVRALAAATGWPIYDPQCGTAPAPEAVEAALRASLGPATERAVGTLERLRSRERGAPGVRAATAEVLARRLGPLSRAGFFTAGVYLAAGWWFGLLVLVVLIVLVAGQVYGRMRWR